MLEFVSCPIMVTTAVEVCTDYAPYLYLLFYSIMLEFKIVWLAWQAFLAKAYIDANYRLNQYFHLYLNRLLLIRLTIGLSFLGTVWSLTIQVSDQKQLTRPNTDLHFGWEHLVDFLVFQGPLFLLVEYFENPLVFDLP